MSISQGIVISRKARGLSQKELGIHYTQSMVSMIEKGERQIAPDVAPQLANKLDHPALLFNLTNELTGGFGPAWLDGPNVDLHRSSVREKTREALTTALNVIDQFSSSKPPGAENEQDHSKRRDHLFRVLDGIEAAYMYIGIQCEEYGYSLMQLSRDHHNQLRGKRYVQS